MQSGGAGLVKRTLSSELRAERRKLSQQKPGLRETRVRPFSKALLKEKWGAGHIQRAHARWIFCREPLCTYMLARPGATRPTLHA